VFDSPNWRVCYFLLYLDALQRHETP